ncbi:tetratricopeptide repeat protein [Acidiferrobacter thiooxydans]|uniref:tetratricopeptide repeat protein n=1 Tax=Acidiferrobacter thiooxydans TaxID=163359 RepID=UPI003989BEC7
MDLGSDYATGRGVSQDYAKAVYWYKKAAAQGISAGETALGSLYANRHGVLKNYVKAVYWYRRAAAQGYIYAESNLGLAYLQGLGVPQDDTSALKWLILAKAGGLAAAAQALHILERVAAPAQVAQAQTLAKQWWARHHGTK